MKNLSGMTFCITGTLSKGRKQFINLIEQAGGVFKRDMSNMVTFLIVGADAHTKHTEKLARADKLCLPILTEKEFLTMLSSE